MTETKTDVRTYEAYLNGNAAYPVKIEATSELEAAKAFARPETTGYVWVRLLGTKRHVCVFVDRQGRTAFSDHPANKEDA